MEEKIEELFVMFYVVDGRETNKIVMTEIGAAVCDSRNKQRINCFIELAKLNHKDINTELDKSSVGSIAYTFKRDKFVTTF